MHEPQNQRSFTITLLAIPTTHTVFLLKIYSGATEDRMAANDSGDEFEPFQMTEEEFLPKRRKMTKEDHIYGLWAEHDSDEDDR